MFGGSVSIQLPPGPQEPKTVSGDAPVLIQRPLNGKCHNNIITFESLTIHDCM